MADRYWDKPWSLVDGCTPCSPGCDNCWSAAMSHRFAERMIRQTGEPLIDSSGRFTGCIATHTDRLSVPLKRKKPTVYAVWNDLFHEDVPVNFLEDALAVMTNCPQHTFLVLTKRAYRLNLMTSDRLRVSRTDTWPITNLWLGLTVCNQREADEKIPAFLRAPGKKFLSIEPMLGKIDLCNIIFTDINKVDALTGTVWEYGKNVGYYQHQIKAVILGGETGPGARPMHPDWVRSVRDQCAEAGVPFLFKSWGSWKPCDDDHVECKGHKGTAMRLTGEIVTDEKPYWKDKAFGGTDQGFWKAGSTAGRILDGRTHDDLPWRTNT
jgi:protein gp37